MSLRMSKAIVAVLLITVIAACSRSNKIEQNKFLMDTVVEVTAYGLKPADIEPVWPALEKLDKTLSPYNPTSDVSRINMNAGGPPARVSDETSRLINRTVEFSRSVSGVFDPTVLPLARLWNITSAAPKVPADAEIAKVLSLVDYRQVLVTGAGVSLKRKGMALDLGGIAKGYAVDVAADMLKKAGASAALINAGGNIKVFGNRDWKIGIRHPRDKSEVYAVITVRNKAVATSGDYERYFERNGRRYHHIFDPETGCPAAGTISATVVCDEGLLADALSTSLFILGPDEGFKVLERFPGAEAVMVDTEGNVFATKGLRQYVTSDKLAL